MGSGRKVTRHLHDFFFLPQWMHVASWYELLAAICTTRVGADVSMYVHTHTHLHVDVWEMCEFVYLRYIRI